MIRAGLGVDAHAFDAERPLILGGVTIPDAPGLAGHSDADVLSHAIADALLGAAALGDLGRVFPATQNWRDASSLDILARTAQLLAHSGWAIVNIDSSLIAEAPRLAPHIGEMRERVARALSVDTSAVSVKATTADRLGFAGRGEGLAAMAIVLIENRGGDR